MKAKKIIIFQTKINKNDRKASCKVKNIHYFKYLYFIFIKLIYHQVKTTLPDSLL